MPKKKRKTLTPAAIKKVILSEFDSWCKEHGSEPGLRAYVHKQLDDHRKDFVLKVLGFDDHWGRWEVDHCNGRMSQTTKCLTEIVEDETRKWLKANMGPPPELPKRAAQALRTQYREDYERQLREVLRRGAQVAATERAEHMLEDLFVRAFGKPKPEGDAHASPEEENRA